jgi:hypothetical protein
MCILGARACVCSRLCAWDQYSRMNRTWTAPIGVDSQRSKSPGGAPYVGIRLTHTP